MPALIFEHVEKRFGDVVVVEDFSLEVGDGELIVLVGASGSGKSTILRLVAGLEAVTGGRIRIDGRDITELPPRRRDVAMVFQDYALYPHMTVGENLSIGLRLRRVPKTEIDRRVSWAAGMLGLEPLLERRPSQLSGGQRQRVAMGRAMVREPLVFLFDEPLSNLDAGLRAQMRIEVGELQRRLGTTTVYVTHDQVEAMTMGHRIVVLADGRIQQVGRPIDLYQRPVNRYVAGFIGTPPMNFIEGVLRVDDGATLFVADGVRIELPETRPTAEHAGPPWPKPGTPVTLGVRPEDLRLVTAPATGAGATGILAGKVRLVERLGGTSHIHFEVGAHRLVGAVSGTRLPEPGDTIGVRVPAEHVHLFGPGGGALR